MSLLDFLRNKPQPRKIFEPKVFGPAFSWVGDNQIKILEGELDNQTFLVQKEFTANDARLIFSFQGHRIGHCFAEIEKKSLITIWDIVVDKSYQHKGIASMMVKILTRELIFQQRVSYFKFRMLQLYKPGDKEIRLQNVGVGVIVYKLGLSCEYDLSVLIKRNNIISIDVISPYNSMPPAYKIVISEYPFTLIAFMIDWDTEKPITDIGTYLKFSSRSEVILDWAKTRAMIVGNANYLLKGDGITAFINRLATSKSEGDLFYNRVRGIH